ncbi:MAG: hypothetical protein E7378_00110 [Clostridiales bacterium]|nr:hypothetical protein [Clostridiales bacterium]
MLIFIIVFTLPIFSNRQYCYAEENNVEVEQELQENIDQQLNSLDMSQLDQMLQELVNDDSIFAGDSFKAKVSQIINGEIALDSKTFIDYLLNIFLDDVLNFLPYMCLIIAIAVLYSMVSSAKGSKNKSIGDVVHFVCYGAIVVIVVFFVSHILALVGGALSSVKKQMDAVFPILLTVLTSLGTSVSVGVYQPAMAMLSGTVVSIFTNVLLPIFSFMLVFTIISNLTTNIKFNKFADFFRSAFKWLMGIVLTLFSAFVSIQGLMAGSVDTISIKATKYTIKSAVPYVGGFLSDGVGLISLSGVLIKNAVGVGGLMLLFCTVLSPVIKIIVFGFLLKLAAAILEPIADSRVSNFVASIAKSIQLLTALILGVAFMYFLMIGLIMCSTNLI